MTNNHITTNLASNVVMVSVHAPSAVDHGTVRHSDGVKPNITRR
jgi:hypothetical protein